MRVLVALLCAVVFPLVLHAQSEFLPRGQSGYGILGGVHSSDDIWGLGMSAGYGYKGLLDCGGRINLAVHPQNPYTTIGPYFGIYPVKQDKKKEIPVSVSASLALDYMMGRDPNTHILELGASVIRELRLSRGLSVLPSVGLTWLKPMYRGVDSRTALVFGMPIVIGGDRQRILVSPSLTFTEDRHEVGISLGTLVIHDFHAVDWEE